MYALKVKKITHRWSEDESRIPIIFSGQEIFYKFFARVKKWNVVKNGFYFFFKKCSFFGVVCVIYNLEISNLEKPTSPLNNCFASFFLHHRIFLKKLSDLCVSFVLFLFGELEKGKNSFWVFFYIKNNVTDMETLQWRDSDRAIKIINGSIK